MSFLGNFFGEIFGGTKEKSLEELFPELKEAQRKKDFVAVCKLYYQIGEVYFKQGNGEKALLYLSRFDSLSGSKDEIYKKINSKMVDQASVWIEKLEEESMYTHEIRDRVDIMGEALNGQQRIQWNLLTMARLQTLFLRLSALKGFSILAGYEKVVELLHQSLYRSLEKEEILFLEKFLKDFYPFTDSEDLSDTTKKLTIESGADFEAYDLTGELTLLNLYTFIDDMLQIVEGNTEAEDINTDFVTNGMLVDYYIRTREQKLRNVPELKEETQRIFADCEFVKTNPNQMQMQQRMDVYKKLSLPA